MVEIAVDLMLIQYTAHYVNALKEEEGVGEHITDTYITETDTTELENLSHNIIDIFIFEA